jgi:hypothetical protein
MHWVRQEVYEPGPARAVHAYAAEHPSLAAWCEVRVDERSRTESTRIEVFEEGQDMFDDLDGNWDPGHVFSWGLSRRGEIRPRWRMENG